TANTGYDKERIKIVLNSNVCEVSLKTKSTTAAGTNAGGSGAGMITARYADGTNKNKIINNGDTVPNGTNIKLTFTPDYGSRFITASSTNGLNFSELERITGTDSYQVTVNNITSVNVTTKDGKTTTNYSTRTKTITATFAQTFNANDKVTDTSSTEYNKYQHISNKGMRPDADDPFKDTTDFTSNFEICGVQIKTDENNPENKALRFISVIDKHILSKAASYGYVIGYTNQSLDNKTINKFSYTLVKDGASGKTIDCTGSGNSTFGDYGSQDTDTNYKYITASVNNIPDSGGTINVNTKIIARPYVVLKDEYIARDPSDSTIKVGPSVIYGQYIDISTGEASCACSGSYSYVSSLAG
ncbi:MAG: hypothetical protein K6F88_07250, partial [Ruminococcus sp.]|nr:hypothetical protein [Ruminococcus sp.]